jgi:hypothetical protein
MPSSLSRKYNECSSTTVILTFHLLFIPLILRNGPFGRGRKKGRWHYINPAAAAVAAAAAKRITQDSQKRGREGRKVCLHGPVLSWHLGMLLRLLAGWLYYTADYTQQSQA